MTEGEILAAVERFPLPEGVNDAVLNKVELASFFVVSPTTIDAWIRDGLPYVSEGTNGRAWEFQASHAWAWRQAREAGEREKSDEAQRAIQAMRLALVGGKAGDGIQSLAPRERKELYQVTAAYDEMRAKRGQLIDRGEVRESLEMLLSLVRDSVTSYSDRLEREAGLSPKAVEKVNEMGDEMLEQLQQMVTDFFAKRPVDAEAAPADLFEATGVLS